jgi:hypothetical protein
MKPSTHCQRCGSAASEQGLRYRRGQETVSHASLLQCDVCERFACSECLEVFDILSGYDFLCADCARQFPAQPVAEGKPPAVKNVPSATRLRRKRDNTSRP